MNPATHVFMNCLLVELRNQKKNEQEKKNQEEVMKKNRVTGNIQRDEIGRLVIDYEQIREEGKTM